MSHPHAVGLHGVSGDVGVVAHVGIIKVGDSPLALRGMVETE